MRTNVKREWIAALRSGNYKQGKSKLKQNDSYCCLGVLCDLAAKAGIVQEFTLITGSIAFGDKLGTSTSTYLPDRVMEWAGLTKSNPTVAGHPLAELNDRGTSFNQIANLIRLFL